MLWIIRTFDSSTLWSSKPTLKFSSKDIVVMKSFRFRTSQNASHFNISITSETISSPQNDLIYNNGFLIWLPLQFFHEIPSFRLKYLENQFLLKACQDSAVHFLLRYCFPTLKQYFWILQIFVKWSLPQYESPIHPKIMGVTLALTDLKHFGSYVMLCTLLKTL